jgi:hypothetical protein
MTLKQWGENKTEIVNLQRYKENSLWRMYQTYLNFPGLWSVVRILLTTASGLMVPHHTCFVETLCYRISSTCLQTRIKTWLGTASTTFVTNQHLHDHPPKYICKLLLIIFTSQGLVIRNLEQTLDIGQQARDTEWCNALKLNSQWDYLFQMYVSV